MASFDITSLLDFNPPTYICPACRGLIGIELSWRGTSPHQEAVYSCPVCAVEYIQEDYAECRDWLDAPSIYDHFRKEGWHVDHKDLLDHATTLARTVRESRRLIRRQWPTTRTFFEIISRAKYFVHFTSWGISHVMIGALKMASMHVPVYGFVSNVEAGARAELTEYPDEAPRLTAKVIPSEQGIYDAPHQKILIIDGLVAFKGSTNLTNAGPRRADRALDISEVVTDFTQVTALNNKYFAPVWRRITAPSDAFNWRAVPDW